jgi:PAS domain S-box-containing protein
MTGQDTSTTPDPLPGRVDVDLRAERLRLYQGATLASLAAHAGVAGFVVLTLWDQVASERLIGWLLVVLSTLLARALVWRAQRHDGPGEALARARLRQVRLAVLAMGAAWGLAGLLLLGPGSDVQQRAFLAFVLAGMAAGSLTLVAFDVATSLGFAVAALLPLGLNLFGGGAEGRTMALMVLLFLAFLGLVALRAQRNLREAVRLRSAEALRADTLQRNQARLQQISEELGRKSEALQLTLDSMAQGILSMDADGRTNFYNRRLMELVDLPESLLAARPTMDEIARYQVEHGHYGQNLELVIDVQARAALAGWIEGRRRPFPLSYFRRMPSGTVLEVKSRYVPGGGLVRTFSDVSPYFEAQRKLEESEAQARKLALVAAHTDNAVVITDAAQRVEWVNEGFTRQTGHRSEGVAGHPVRELLAAPGTDDSEVARIDEQLARDRRATGELRLQGKDGRTRWFALEAQAILDDDGRVQRYIFTGRDVSARRAAEEDLRAARDEAERANRAKSEFLSAMSHELRTPLNAILGFGQLLASDPAFPLPERQQAQVQEIVRAGAHLLELINDVLDLARVEAGKQPISIEPVRVAPLVDECLALLRPQAQQRGIRLDAAAPQGCHCFVAADRTRLKQVLLNLLSNAVKYDRDGGRVQVACGADGDAVRITVSDSGPGLDAERRERLFNSFERLGAEDGPIPGAGIGLVLSKRMVELMHGSLGLDSEPGRGSTFWLLLPRAQPPAVPAAMAPAAVALQASPHDAGTNTVLYIEDNPVNVLLMEAMLEREPGVRLLTALEPEGGLKLAFSEQPALILLDIQLPGIDGFEVLRRLRAAASTRATPVIAISANAMPADIRQGMEAGFDAYLTKPLEVEQLRTTVRQALHRNAGGAPA